MLSSSSRSLTNILLRYQSLFGKQNLTTVRYYFGPIDLRILVFGLRSFFGVAVSDYRIVQELALGLEVE
jgi:hypothetical protein